MFDVLILCLYTMVMKRGKELYDDFADYTAANKEGQMNLLQVCVVGGCVFFGVFVATLIFAV